MLERFHGKLDPAVLHDLSQRDDRHALLRAGSQTALLAGSAAVLLTTTAALPWWTAFVVQVAAQFAMFGMLHESTHGTAFASSAGNTTAQWIAAVWQFAPPAWMRAFHFTHHRHTHEVARDPELGGMEGVARWPRGIVWLITVSGLPILIARFAITLVAATGLGPLMAKALPYVVPEQRPAIRRDARLLLLVHGAIVGIGWWVAMPVATLYLAAIPAHAVLSGYLTCEHRGLPAAGDVLQRTRSLAAGPLLRYLAWNMPWHAEHHAYPAVPFHALPRLHRLLAAELPHAGRSVLQIHLRRGEDIGPAPTNTPPRA